MTGKERIYRAFRLESTDVIPWVPFVGVHGAFVTGIDAESYLKSAKAIVKGISKAIDLYQPDGIPVVFDLQVEAEALGCQLKWAKDNPPAVVSHPLADGTSNLSDMVPINLYGGRIAICMDAAEQLRKRYPDTALYGLITGPFTLALHLAGTDIFMKMLEQPEEVAELMDYCSGIARQMASWYIDAGCDVIAVVDPMTSQIDPFSFEQFVSPASIEIFDIIRQKGALSSFFVCGFAQQNIEEMCKCRPDNISIDENIPLDYVKEMALKYGLSFGGNLRLTSVLSMGDIQDVEIHAIETLELGGAKGFVLAPGCDLVMDTPVENLQAVTRIVRDIYHREFVKTLAINKPEKKSEIDLSTYWKKDKVIVDIITLDSSSCAPCQYMVEAVRLAAEPFGSHVECHEHSIKKKAGIEMMQALGVKNVPVTVINGEITFISNIPPLETITKAIKEKLQSMR
jgi:MtaA/CmuA family methyltransferase